MPLAPVTVMTLPCKRPDIAPRLRRRSKAITIPGDRDSVSPCRWSADLGLQCNEVGAVTLGAAAYAKRQITVEPVFGHLKANLGYRGFLRRSLDAVESEWRLICIVHNLTKIHRHRIATS